HAEEAERGRFAPGAGGPDDRRRLDVIAHRKELYNIKYYDVKNREPGTRTGNREPEPGTGNREPGTGNLERILDRRTLRREQLRAVRRDDHVVFEAHAELAADVDPRLVAEYHARLHRQRLLPAVHVVLHEIRPLVAVHPHAVPDAMAEVLESGSVAGV